MGAAYDKGIVLFRQRRYKAAAEQFIAEAVDDPDCALTRVMLAHSLLYDGRPGAALAEADEAARLDPELPLAHLARARVLEQVPAGKPMRSFRLSLSSREDDEPRRIRRAKAALDEALRLDPDYADAHLFAAHLEASRDRWKASLRAAERALQLTPDDVEAANARARALTALGRAGEADCVIGESLRIDPEFAPGHNARGWSLLRAGHAGEAAAAFREALRLDAMDSEAKHGLFHARAAKWAFYRWPMRFFLARTQGVGALTAGVIGALALLFGWKIAWWVPWQWAVATFIAIIVVPVLFVRPVTHLTAWFRR